MNTTSILVLWLFVVTLGIALGAGLYEHRIVLPDWIGGANGQWNPQAARHDDTGRRFWAFVTTGPLTLLTLASAFLAWRATGEARAWWLAAAGTALVERALTFAYFIPTIVRLTRSAASAAATEAAHRWARLNYLRHALVLVALVCALKAFAELYAQRG